MQNQPKQHTLWLLAAASAPLAHYSGCGWLTALVTAAVILPLTMLPKSWEGMPRTLALVQILWLGAVAGLLLQNSAAYWPSDNRLVVPLTLLPLAAVTRNQSAPRLGPVLAYCIALLALPVAVSGAVRLEPQWLKETSEGWPGFLAPVLLLPSLPGAGEGHRGQQGIFLGLTAGAVSFLVQGILSPAVAGSVPDPFYQTVRTLGYLEPVAAVGMTLGWYALTIYLLNSASQIAENAEISRKLTPVLTTGTALGVLLSKWQPGVLICMVLSTFLWVLAPFVTKIKKSKKDEKRC